MTVRHLAALAAIALSACVSVPNQPYNKAANAHVKKIGVVAVPNPAEYQVGMLHHPGEGFGLIGGLIAAGDASSKTKTFSSQEVVHRIELGKEMTTALTEAFDGSPFQVVLVDAGAGPRTEFVKDYPGAECDAFLDVAIAQVGYRAQYASTPAVRTGETGRRAQQDSALHHRSIHHRWADSQGRDTACTGHDIRVQRLRCS